MLRPIVLLIAGILCLGYYGCLCVYLRKWDSTFSRFWLLSGMGFLILCFLERKGYVPEAFWLLFYVVLGAVVVLSLIHIYYAMLEYCIREDLKLKKPRMMAILDPIKLVIDNYPEGEMEWLDAENNLENESLGKRKIPFCRELYIERDDFMIEPPKKYFRLFPDNEVRLMQAYFVKCTGYELSLIHI